MNTKRKATAAVLFILMLTVVPHTIRMDRTTCG